MWPESSPINAVNLVKKSATIPEISNFGAPCRQGCRASDVDVYLNTTGSRLLRRIWTVCRDYVSSTSLATQINLERRGHRRRLNDDDDDEVVPALVHGLTTTRVDWASADSFVNTHAPAASSTQSNGRADRQRFQNTMVVTARPAVGHYGTNPSDGSSGGHYPGNSSKFNTRSGAFWRRICDSEVSTFVNIFFVGHGMLPPNYDTRFPGHAPCATSSFCFLSG